MRHIFLSPLNTCFWSWRGWHVISANERSDKSFCQWQRINVENQIISRVKLIGWWEILSWICKNPCNYRMLFAHKTPMLLNDNNTQICPSIFEQECACLEFCHHDIFVKGTTLFNKKQHGRYLKTRPWCSHGISVRDFQGWKREKFSKFGGEVLCL